MWLNLRLPRGDRVWNLGWIYWLPNPLLPCVAFRVAFDGTHPDLLVEEFAASSERPQAAPESTEPEPGLPGSLTRTPDGAM